MNYGLGKIGLGAQQHIVTYHAVTVELTRLIFGPALSAYLRRAYITSVGAEAYFHPRCLKYTTKGE